MEPLPSTPPTLHNLAEQLQKLPGIGPRSALNIAISIARDETAAPESLAEAIQDTVQNVQHCRICRVTATEPECPICADPDRRQDQICLVAESIDVPMLERLKHYQGRYHVLHGLLSPMDGVTPDRLTIPALLKRLDRLPSQPVAELIIATPATVEGDMTAHYIWQQCLDRGYRFSITRLRRGLAHRSRLEYAHPTDLTAALDNRQLIDQEPVPPPSA